MVTVSRNAATEIFNIPELLELILLSLPWDRMYEEIHSTRFVLLSQTTSRTWQRLLRTSVTVRRMLYLPCISDRLGYHAWIEKSPFPPSQPNPWIPFLLMQRRSWGTAYPFDNTYSAYNLDPSQPKLWTFAIEISRRHLEAFPSAGTWRQMLASSPPFTKMYCTRAFYELGSGRAPFVTFLDYDPRLPKQKQKYVKWNATGITLGDIADMVEQLFATTSSNYIKWVRLESIRCPPEGKENDECYKDATEGMPKTRDLLPTSSAMLWTEHYSAS